MVGATERPCHSVCFDECLPGDLVASVEPFFLSDVVELLGRLNQPRKVQIVYKEFCIGQPDQALVDKLG